MNSCSPRPGDCGFTMVEVMVVVAIVAILAAAAYPFYSEQVDKARRADAMTSLQQLVIEQAKWRANNPSYTATLTDVWDNFEGTTAKSLDGYYVLRIVNGSVSATGFQALAAPTGAQRGDACGTFCVDEEGRPVTADPYADAECWRR